MVSGAKPRDEQLYKSVKSRLYKKMPTHSAYRSAILVKNYKASYKRKYGNGDPYIGKKPDSKVGLTRWLKEDWRNQRGEVGYKYKSDVYRPTKRVTAKTPKTFGELSKDAIKRSRRVKAKTGRVKRF
jgi:Family of unknown function (DUF5872)